MSEKKVFTCDICNKGIHEGSEEMYMGKVTINWTETVTDGGITTESRMKTYHIHNDFKEDCLSKLWDILEKDRK
jgi:hypothetical protein